MFVVINQNVDILTEFLVKHVETSSKDPSNYKKKTNVENITCVRSTN